MSNANNRVQIQSVKVGNMIGIRDIPNIPNNLSIEDAVKYLIPQGFDAMFQVQISATNDLELIFVNPDNQFERTIKIPEFIYNPDKFGAFYPKFMFQASTVVPTGMKRPDYFGNESFLVLNQNQVLYAIIQHRATFFLNYTNQWIGLLNKDISNLRRYVDFNTPVSYNAKMKSLNTYVVIEAFDKKTNLQRLDWLRPYTITGNGTSYPMGELILRHPQKESLKSVMSDIKMHPGSESMLESGSKIVAFNGNDLFKSPGYFYNQRDSEAPYVGTIFPLKQNIPARLKTHVLGDCFEALNPIKKPIYEQDYINVDGKMVAKDNGLIGAVIVFDDMELDTGRFMFGEIEQSEDLAATLIIKRKIVHQQFSDVTCEVGTKARDGRIVLGKDLDEKDVVIHGIKGGVVTSIMHDDINQSAKIVVNTYIEAGNARIVNPFGIKGFTKTKKSLGHLEMADGRLLPVQLITGMNAVKGKQNTIVAARAALAHKLGYYQNGHSYLRSLSQQEINLAASKIDRVKYVDPHGNVKYVWAGYIEYYVTEIGSMYAKFKPQNFMFEVGKYLEMQSDKRLFNFIWNDCIDQRSKDIALELHKILIDKSGVFAYQESLPVYTPSEIREVFNKADLITTSQSRWDTDSRLFNPDYNKGFYIDMRRYGGPMIRMPSGQMLSAIKGQLPNGIFVYPMIISIISRIIGNLTVRNEENGQYNIGFVWNKTGKKTQYDSYMEEVEGMLYRNEEKGMTMAQALIKPSVMGVNMKQVTDHLVPWDVVVIYDRDIYYNIQAHVSSGIFENKHLGALAMGDKEIYGLAIRNPALWKTQVAKVRIWDEVKFNQYLESVGVDPEMHLSGKYCRQSIVISPYLTLIQHSDNDGDLLPLFVPHGEGQKILEEFKLENVAYNEAKWTTEYYKKEFDSNAELYDEPVYKLYKLPMQFDNQNPKTYPEYLVNAAIAKSNIGSATQDIWTLYAVMQMYQSLCLMKGTAEDAMYQKYIAPWKRKSSCAPSSISADQISQISYVYTRLVEEYVINAIKHMEGGSSHFEIYYLDNMTKAQNLKIVSEKLIKEFELSPRYSNVIMEVVEWAKQTSILKGIKSFISLYNKGTKPNFSQEEELIKAGTLNVKEVFELIANNTFFGSLVKELFANNKVMSDAASNNFVYDKFAKKANKSIGDFSSDADDDIMKMFG